MEKKKEDSVHSFTEGYDWIDDKPDPFEKRCFYDAKECLKIKEVLTIDKTMDVCRECERYKAWKINN